MLQVLRRGWVDRREGHNGLHHTPPGKHGCWDDNPARLPTKTPNSLFSLCVKMTRLFVLQLEPCCNSSGWCINSNLWVCNFPLPSIVKSSQTTPIFRALFFHLGLASGSSVYGLQQECKVPQEAKKQFRRGLKTVGAQREEPMPGWGRCRKTWVEVAKLSASINESTLP